MPKIISKFTKFIFFSIEVLENEKKVVDLVPGLFFFGQLCGLH